MKIAERLEKRQKNTRGGKGAVSRRTASSPAKHVLKVRALMARVAWLDGMLCWSSDGAITVTLPEAAVEAEQAASVVPTPGRLARSQYALLRIAAHPHSARAALGGSDPAEWIAAREARLETLKAILAQGISITAPPDDPEALAALLPLEQETLIQSPATLPFSPTEILIQRRARSITALRNAATAPHLSPAARSLASLCLGIVNGDAAAGLNASGKAAGKLGVIYGYPTEPALLAALVAAAPPEESVAQIVERAERFLLARETTRASAFHAPVSVLNDLLRQKGGAEAVVTLCETIAADTAPLEARLRRRRHELPRRPEQESAKEASEWRGARADVVRQLAALLYRYVTVAGASEATRAACLFTRFLCGMLDAAGKATPLLTPHLEPALLRPLRAPLSDPVTALAVLELLTTERKRLWGPLPTPTPLRSRHIGWLRDRILDSRDRVSHLERAWATVVRPNIELLRKAGGTFALPLARQLLPLNFGQSVARHLVNELCEGGEIKAEDCRTAIRRIIELDGFTEEEYPAIRLFVFAVRTARDGARARSAFASLIRAVRRPDGSLDPARRRLLFALVNEDHGTEPREKRLALLDAAANQVLPNLALMGTGENRDDEEQGNLLAGVLSAAAKAGEPGRTRALLRAAFHSDIEAAAQDRGWGADSELRIAATVVLALSGDYYPEEERLFEERVASVTLHLIRHSDYRSGAILQGKDILARFPALRSPLAALLTTQTGRCLDLLTAIGSLCFEGDGGSTLAPFAAFDPGSADVPCGTAEVDDPEWAEFLAALPKAAPLAAAYWHARWLTGQSGALPASVRRAAANPAEKFARELAYLEADPELASQPKVARRIENLRARLEGMTNPTKEDVAGEAITRLTIALHEAQMAAAEMLVQECYRARCAAMIGNVALRPGVQFDDDRCNAVRVGTHITANRRLLLRLLRIHVGIGPEGARHFVAAHPKNKRFLEELAASGADAEVWTAERPKTILLPDGTRVRLCLERDPLRILQMGNPFDTCLSADGFNAFSTVTNACELNKRVLFAYDKATGKIVGRKLIGLTREGRLLGFHTYTTLDVPEDAAALRAAIRHYLLRFAADCRLETADEGTIPTLFAESWYDDGAVPWTDSEDGDQNTEAHPPRPSKP